MTSECSHIQTVTHSMCELGGHSTSQRGNRAKQEESDAFWGVDEVEPEGWQALQSTAAKPLEPAVSKAASAHLLSWLALSRL